MGLGLVEAGASIAMASCFNLLSLRSMPILRFSAAAALLQSDSESDTSRLAMMKYGVKDIRDLNGGTLAAMSQFTDDK